MDSDPLFSLYPQSFGVVPPTRTSRLNTVILPGLDTDPWLTSSLVVNPPENQRVV